MDTGADVGAPDLDGMAAVDWAARGGHYETKHHPYPIGSWIPSI